MNQQVQAGLGLTWKIVATFAGTTLFIGSVIIAAVYYHMSHAVRSQTDERALIIATNISAAAVTHVQRKDASGLSTLLARQAQLPEVAYALVEDRNGSVLGYAGEQFSPHLETLLGNTDLREIRRTLTRIGDRGVYDTRVPLLDGGIGAVHVGIWQSAIDNVVNQALFPVIGLLLIILITTTAVAIAVARKISKPISSLARSVDQISRGELDLPVQVESNDEVGDLGRSVERLRASLKEAMVRLDREDS
ncbi:MAG TPA: HAMP domain-containing protein [Nitrospira sp.]